MTGPCFVARKDFRMMTSKVVAPPKSPLVLEGEKAVKDYEAKLEELSDHEKEHLAVFEARARLIEQVAALEKQMHALAVQAAGNQGPAKGEKNTRPVFVGRFFYVQTQHRKKSASYDPRFLPKELLTPTTVKEVDTKLVEAKAVELGEKGAKLLENVRNKPGAYTPAGWQNPSVKIVRGTPDETDPSAEG